MGTLLYSKGIFINRCYDELNLSQPDLIRGIHHEYLQAGAEIIETNTFGAKFFPPGAARPGGQSSRHQFAGARLAREAAKSFDVWVAGAVGPLGIRIEPLGKMSFQEARDVFREQIAALVEGGVDLLILETFGYIEEIHQAMLAARDVDPRFRWWRRSRSTKTEIAWTVRSGDFRSEVGGMGSGRYRLQLQRGAGGHAGCDGADAGGDFPAAVGATQRRNPALGGRTKYLSVLAGIHGELCAQICGCGSAVGGRMLRHHAGTYSRDEVGVAGGRSARQDGVGTGQGRHAAPMAVPTMPLESGRSWAQRWRAANS